MTRDILKTIRFEEDEADYLEKKAKREKRKLSDFMRCELLKDKDVKGWDK